MYTDVCYPYEHVYGNFELPYLKSGTLNKNKKEMINSGLALRWYDIKQAQDIIQYVLYKANTKKNKKSIDQPMSCHDLFLYQWV